jgi:hypothetical protein
LCHTPIKPDLLGFPGIGVFVCELRDHEVHITIILYSPLNITSSTISPPILLLH